MEDRLPLQGAGGAEHRAGACDEDAPQLTALHPPHQPPAAHRRHAAAAAAARVWVLLLGEQRVAAVDQLAVGHLHAAALEQLHQQVAADPAQVAGGDQVVVVGAAACVLQMGHDGVVHRRGHGCAHVVRVLDLLIHHAPHRAAAYFQILRLGVGRQQRAAAGGGGPGGLGRALGAHLQGKAKLALRRAEVAGGAADGVVQKAAGEQRAAQHQRLHEGGARAVLAEEGDAQRPGGEARRDDLVVQVAGDHHLHVLRAEACLLQRVIHRPAHHLALRQLPALHAQQVIVQQDVELIRQRALALFGAHDAGAGGDARRVVVHEGLSAHSAHRNHILAIQ